MLYELARVLRYPRMLALHGLSEKRIYDYVGFLHEAAGIVILKPLWVGPIRDVNDIVVNADRGQHSRITQNLG